MAIAILPQLFRAWLSCARFIKELRLRFNVGIRRRPEWVERTVLAHGRASELDDLARVEATLAASKLEVVRLSGQKVGARPTPDFKIVNGDELIAYCEVKSPGQDNQFLDQLLGAPPDVILEEVRPDPTFNRLSSHIHKAVKQFDAVNPDRSLLNILAFVNHDSAVSAVDLYETVTGHLPAADGRHYATMQRVSERRIREDKQRIDLYIWFDVATGQRRFLISPLDAERDRFVRAVFGLEQRQSNHG